MEKKKKKTPEQAPSTSNHCMPRNQKYAQAFLAGEVPSIMDQIAPDSKTGAQGYEGWQESEETVERLRQWREEAPYG